MIKTKEKIMNELLMKLLALPGILFAISIHEYAHALVSYKLGDPTPKQEGRLTIEPFAHINLIGLLFMFLIGFGWANPVNVDPRFYKNPKKGMFLVALAGPVANIIMVVLFSILLRLSIDYLQLPEKPMELLNIMISDVALYNLFFFLFNLIPVPPLDGSKVLMYFLPPKLQIKFIELERYSMIIFILIVATPIVSYILIPPAAFISTLIFNTIGVNIF